MKTKQELEELAQQMRLKPTKFERDFGDKLAAANVAFLPQQVIGCYIADFVIPERMLVIELDGIQHTVQTDYDRQRDTFLINAGFRVYRFWNSKSKHWNPAEIAKLPTCRPSAYPDALKYADLLLTTGKGFERTPQRSQRIKPPRPQVAPKAVAIVRAQPATRSDKSLRRQCRNELKKIVNRVLQLPPDTYQRILKSFKAALEESL